MTKQTMPDDLITITEARGLLKRLRTSVIAFIESGRLPAWRGRRAQMLLVSKAAVLALYEEYRPELSPVRPEDVRAERQKPIEQEKAPADILTTTAVAREVGVSQGTVCRWIQDGLMVRGALVQLDALKAGQSWRIRREDLKAFLAACNPGKPIELESERRERKESARRATEEVRRLAQARGRNRRTS